MCQYKTYRQKSFPDLAELAERVLSLLHLNAGPERIFSSVSDVKTKKAESLEERMIERNKKERKNIEAVFVTKSRLRTNSYF